MMQRKSQTTSNYPDIHQAIHAAIGEERKETGTAAASLRFAALAIFTRKPKNSKTYKREKTEKKDDTQNELNYL